VSESGVLSVFILSVLLILKPIYSKSTQLTSLWHFQLVWSYLCA